VPVAPKRFPPNAGDSIRKISNSITAAPDGQDATENMQEIRMKNDFRHM
jgi:hypothetical protein